MVASKLGGWAFAAVAVVSLGAPGCVAEQGSSDDGSAAAGTEEVAQASSPLGAFNVLTRSYNNQRTSANLSETTLNTSNVNANGFGKLFEMAVDDQVYAQPLYASSVAIPNQGTHDVLYVATVNSSIYAFDANNGALLWQKNYNVAGGRPPRNYEVAHGQACGGNYRDFLGNIGIVGTPVIDGSTSTLYFVTRSLDNGTTMVYRKMAVDITTGNHKFNSPQPLFTPTGTQPSAFDPWYLNQRAGLALASGRVYVSFAAYCDAQPYQGWMVAFPASNLALQQTGVFNAAPSGALGAGIWQAGNAPAVDGSGNVYAMTGNGEFDNASNWGESLVRLAPSTLAMSASNRNMTPSNWVQLNNADDDFGSAGPSVYSSLGYVLGGGKEGKVYARPLTALGGVVNTSTGFQAVSTTAVPNTTHHIHNGLVLWSGPSGASIYVWGENDFLRRYLFTPSASPQFTVPATGAAGPVLPPWGMPGGIMSLSANGSTAGSGILWATTPSQGNANQSTTPGVLRAFHAETLQLLWDSSQNPGDDIYELAKFVPPVVANGKVYMASFSGVVSAFGLRSGPTPPLANGVYQVRTNTTAGKCVDVSNSGTADGTNVQQWGCNGSNAQRWQFINVANNIYEIRTLASNKCLDVSNSGTADGTNVQEWTCNGSNAQRWAVVALGNGLYQLKPQTATNRCLDVSNSGTADGTNVQQWTCNGTNAQAFTLAIDSDTTPLVSNRTYRITNVIADKCVDVSNGDPFDGTNVQEWTCNGSDAQRWRFRHLGGDIYEVRTAVSDLCLDVDNSGTADGTNVWTYTCNGTNAQRWLLSRAGNGQYRFLPQTGANLCLDVDNSGTADGTNIHEWTCNGTNAQYFRVIAP